VTQDLRRKGGDESDIEKKGGSASVCDAMGLLGDSERGVLLRGGEHMKVPEMRSMAKKNPSSRLIHRGSEGIHGLIGKNAPPKRTLPLEMQGRGENDS